MYEDGDRTPSFQIMTPASAEETLQTGRVKSLLSEDRREGRHAESKLYLFEYVGVYRIAPLDDGVRCHFGLIVHYLS